MEKLRKIWWITLAWVAISVFQYLIALNVILDLEYEITFDPWFFFRASIYTGVLAGIIGGGTLVMVWDKWLRSKPYGWTIRNIFISYTITFYIVSILSGLVYQSNLNNAKWYDSIVWNEVLKNLFSFTVLIPYSVWLLVVIITMIVFLVNDKYGPGVFKKFLLGKYFNPTREERVFMFLDLKSSTTIAEELGEERYFNFIRDVFKEITPAILKYKGEIYQYVGDEVVISWKINEGIHEEYCIKCFLEVKATLHQAKTYFMEQYRTTPTFKAGLHCGHVMAGEVGVVKRDIAYSGDVLNTTARIQSKCNELGTDLLMSMQLKNRVADQASTFSFKELGSILLRGKREEVSLFALNYSSVDLS